MIQTSLSLLFISTIRCAHKTPVLFDGFKLFASSTNPERFATISTPPNVHIATEEFENNRGTGRRVLRLLETLQQDENKNDFTSPVWQTVKYEASAIAEGDLKAATLMANAILSQPSLKEAMIDYVANQLETPLFTATQIRNLFADVCEKYPRIPSLWALDLLSSAVRDSSQPNTVSVLLFNQGFHSLVTYRISNALWYSGRDGLARYFQSLSSRTFGSDIHPACKIGSNCVLASGTGVVIGETAVIGNGCSIAHGVTLGGTGKESGDRHPKIGDGVYLAAGATILGNIKIGDGSIVEAGSVVTKQVDAFSRVGGVPAKLITKFSFDKIDAAEWNTNNDTNNSAENTCENNETNSQQPRFPFPTHILDFQGDLGIGT